MIDDKPTLFVLPLNAPLEPLDPSRVVAIDEKPLSPDAPCSERMSALGVRHSVGPSRSSTWTVTPVINAAGDLIFTQLITRGGSVGCGTLVQIANHLHLARTEKGVQTDDSFLKFAAVWLPHIPTSEENPGVLVVDRHASHLTRAFSLLAAKHHLLVICEPSNLSILLQAGDNGVNHWIDANYAREYTTIFSVTKGAVTIDHRILAISRVMKRITEKKSLVQHSFQAVSLTGDIRDCIGHWIPQQFAIGAQYRDKALPKVSKLFLNVIFSLDQMALPWNSPIFLPDSYRSQVSPVLKEKFQNWLAEEASDPQKLLVGESFTAYQLSRSQNSAEELAVRLWGPKMEWKEENQVSQAPTKNFRGRVNVSIGRNLSGSSAIAEAEAADTKAKEAEQERERREKNRQEQLVKEAPLLEVFHQLGLCDRTGKPKKDLLCQFATANSHLPWSTPFPFKKNPPTCNLGFSNKCPKKQFFNFSKTDKVEKRE